MSLAQPALFALFLWWASTGLVIWLDNRAPRTFIYTFAGATVLFAAALWGLHDTARQQTVSAAYRAFSWGLAAWAWQEVSFYLGYVTGPRRARCAHGCAGWRHFGHALAACLWHELAIAASAIAIWLATRNGPNQIGLETFLLLWFMHESARLNVFLGVRNVQEEFLPPHLDFLKSFLRRRPMNALFPISILVSTALLWRLTANAIAASPASPARAGFALLATLMALAILEHWFLVLPIPITKLWQWSLAFRARREGETLVSWNAALASATDTNALRALLDAAARGEYGNLTRVRGIARAGSGWVRFDLTQGRATLAAFAPVAGDLPSVVAMGKNLDKAGLEAAFQACAIAA